MFEEKQEKAMPEINENELISLCRMMYRECAVDLEVDYTENPYKISMETFVGWCNERNLPRENAETYRNRGNVRDSAIDAVETLFTGSPWKCVAVLYPIWPLVVLSGRPPINNSMHFLHVALTIGFRDRKVVQIQCATPIEPGKPFTDGFVAALLQDQLRQLINNIVHHGVDKLHDEYSQLPAERPEDVQHQDIPKPPPGILGFNMGK